MEARAKLIIAYLGTRYRGWQRQGDGPTIQEELETALSAMVRRPVAVTGAGRTDAGVHAAGQVAHLDLPAPIPVGALIRGLNLRLPGDIRARAASFVHPTFHARRDARAKRYVYRLRWRARSLPWAALRCAVVPPPRALDAFLEALALFPGRHDMASFTVPDPGPPSTVRTLYGVECRRRESGLDIHMIGSGFLRYQVRRMIGAALDVAGGRRDLAWLSELLYHPTPGAPIHTAPAEGLTLERVHYRFPRGAADPVLDSAP